MLHLLYPVFGGGTKAGLDPGLMATVRTAVLAAVAFLRSHADGNGKVGAIGFCWGGGQVNQLAVSEPTLDAAVVYYGRTPDPADVPKIKAPLLLHYAGLDARINEGVPAFRAGTVGEPDGDVHIRFEGGETRHPVALLRRVYSAGIPRRMGD